MPVIYEFMKKNLILENPVVVSPDAGGIEGKEAIIVDDLIDTAGTMVAAANMLINRGAKRVLACATHGVFSGPAVERLTNSPIEQVIITNTIPMGDKMFGKLRVVSVAPLLGEAIKRIHEEESVSSLFV